MNVSKNRKAFSLVELLISILLFGIISASIMVTMSSSYRTSMVSKNVGDMTQSTNSVFELIKRDIELAGSFVMGGIFIPNNNPTRIISGFDNPGCRNNITVAVPVMDISGINQLGTIPAGTDTIAFALMRPASELGIAGCNPATGPIDPVATTAIYTTGSSSLTVGDNSQMICHFNNDAKRPMYAMIMDMSAGMLCEIFSVSRMQLNRIDIASDGFSSGTLLNSFDSGSMIYLLGSTPNTGKIEYFILEKTETNPSDPNTPLRSLVKRVNNRDIYPVADNITNMQITYFFTNGLSSNNLTATPAAIQLDMTIRSEEMIIGDPGSPPDIDGVTQTDRARYFENTYTTIISVMGTVYKPAFDVMYYP